MAWRTPTTQNDNNPLKGYFLVLFTQYEAPFTRERLNTHTLQWKGKNILKIHR